MRNALKNLSKLEMIFIALIFFEIAVLSLKEDQLRNSELLVNAGENLLQRESPYSTPNPYGPLPSAFYRLINLVTHSGDNPSIFILLNLVGCILLIRFLFPNLDRKNFLLLISTLFITSPIRALTTNVQHFGIVVGASILAIISYQNFEQVKQKVFFWMAAFLFLFSLEFKPQNVGPLVLIFVVHKRAWRLVFTILGLSILTRLFFDFWTSRNLEVEQIRIWKIMRTDDLALKEQISPWKVLTYFTNHSVDWFKLSFFFTLAITFLACKIALKAGTRSAAILGIFIPLTSSYLHYYDVIPVVAVLIYFLLKEDNNHRFGMMFGLSFLVLPTHFGTHFKINEIAMLLGLNLLLILGKGLNYRFFFWRLCESFGALIFVSISSDYFSQLEVGLSLLLTLTLIILLPEITMRLKRLLKESNTSA